MVFVVAITAILLGLLLILVLQLFPAPAPEGYIRGEHYDPRPIPIDAVDLSSEPIRDRLMSKLGLQDIREVERLGTRVVALVGTNPAPVIGGDVLCHFVLEGPLVSGDVMKLRSRLRASGQLIKGVLLCITPITDEARETASSHGIEVLDVECLAGLID